MSPLEPDVVQVWLAATDAAARPPSADLSALSPAERARAARFRFDRDREAFVLGKRMARALLGRTLGLAPSAVEFTAGERGKPALAGAQAASGASFNLAHSGTQVALALARGRRVGLDVEREREVADLELARRFYCAREVGLLRAASKDAARRLFFKFWTLKEAYLKAEGSGLGLSLKAMDASGVPDAPLAPPCTPVEDRPRGIRVQRLLAPPGYAAALAADGPPWTTELHAWRAEDFEGR